MASDVVTVATHSGCVPIFATEIAIDVVLSVVDVARAVVVFVVAALTVVTAPVRFVGPAVVPVIAPVRFVGPAVVPVIAPVRFEDCVSAAANKHVCHFAITNVYHYYLISK